jgi:hypothetical protein
LITAPADDNVSAAPATNTVDDEPVADSSSVPAEESAPPDDNTIHEEQASDRLQRARAELADLDDLDV